VSTNWKVHWEALRKTVATKTNGRCAYCGCLLQLYWHVDHMIPRSKGGKNSIDNMIASCPTCNRRKGKKTPLEFELRLAERLFAAVDDVGKGLTVLKEYQLGEGGMDVVIDELLDALVKASVALSPPVEFYYKGFPDEYEE